MESKLSELSKIYLDKKSKDKNLFRYDNPHNLSMFDIRKDAFDITIKHTRVGLNYMVFILIADNKVFLNTPIISADRNLNKEYEQAIEDIKNLSIEEFLEKYYEEIKKSL